VADDDESHDDLRLRIGFNVGGGYAIVDGGGGPAVGVGFRIGAQLNRLMGVYYQTGANVLVATGPGNTSAAAAAFIPNSAMFSLTPVDLFEVAAGPSLDYFGLAAASTSAASAGGGIAFGVAGRAALHLGGRNAETGRRKGFTIGVDVHPIFVGGGVAVPITLGLGADWF